MSAVPELHAVKNGALARAEDLSNNAFDALVVLTAGASKPALEAQGASAELLAAIEQYATVDKGFGKPGRPPTLLAVASAPGGRVVCSSLGTLLDDADDVRAIADATQLAVARACEAGARRPLVLLSVPNDARYARGLEASALAALGSVWQSVEAHEAGKNTPVIEAVGVLGLDPAQIPYLRALEAGRIVARDLTGTEPERMTPLRAAELCEKAFAGTAVRVTVERDVQAWPLLAAVARASMRVERHRPCVVRLEYVPEGPVTRSVFLAGKGVTYDTGGADVKTDGSMAGMSRDKGGAGAVAGFLRTIAELKPTGVRVVGLLGMVRNSIGEEAYVSDEVITSRAGVRVRIGNTDAEGRLVLAELLANLREEAVSAPSPQLFSVATLTGHVAIAYGPVTGAVENGPSRNAGTLEALSQAGERWGEPLEYTRVRREDYTFCAPRSNAEDLVSSNRLASVRTPRGHQGPYAFLDSASGLKGGTVPYAHLDIGGSAVTGLDWQFGRPTGVPVLALTGWLLEK